MKIQASNHSYFLITFLLLVISLSVSCTFKESKTSTAIIDQKQRGAHVFGQIDSMNIQPLKQIHVEWVTLVSWGFQDDYDSPEVQHHNGDSLQMLRHDTHWVNRIQLVRAAGFKVFFKPHLWIDKPTEGKWRSDIYPTNDTNWNRWQTTYRDFILRYARLAERAQAEQFCIGVEFSKLSVQKPLFWKQLIQEVRQVYSGQLTYAANWYEEYEQITFWEDLDFIGIQAYFPVAKQEYPTVPQIGQGWETHLPALEALHQQTQRNILFTEMGYKSTPNSAMKPWEWMDDETATTQVVSLETQANCYTAFFNTVWQKEWMAGIHIWQWRSDYVGGGDRQELDFMPQGKPAERVIGEGFSR